MQHYFPLLMLKCRHRKGGRMKLIAGKVFSIAEDCKPKEGCTVSREVEGGENAIVIFSLDRKTDISPEIFSEHKFLLLLEGDLQVYQKEEEKAEGKNPVLSKGDAILCKVGVPVGMCTEKGAVYTEINIRRKEIMNEAVKAGEVFQLKELVPYGAGEIVNRDVMHNAKMKFVLMAFDEGTGLSEHAAPGEAIVFALEGKATINYEGKDHLIQAGEQFHFAKGGRHSVKAEGRFKMALLLTLE